MWIKKNLLKVIPPALITTVMGVGGAYISMTLEKIQETNDLVARHLMTKTEIVDLIDKAIEVSEKTHPSKEEINQALKDIINLKNQDIELKFLIKVLQEKLNEGEIWEN